MPFNVVPHLPHPAAGTEPIALSPDGNLPRSARITLEAVLRGGPQSIPQLRATTVLAPRTLRFALQRLCEHGLLSSRRSLKDARRSYYFQPQLGLDGRGATALAALPHAVDLPNRQNPAATASPFGLTVARNLARHAEASSSNS